MRLGASSLGGSPRLNREHGYSRIFDLLPAMASLSDLLSYLSSSRHTELAALRTEVLALTARCEALVLEQRNLFSLLYKRAPERRIVTKDRNEGSLALLDGFWWRKDM